MGKRKERRLAAKTASNRRVKLDLLAEPSGEFGDSSTKEEVGGGDNAKNRAGSPSSPSSSGQRPENPLLLLGQYSDEELEEESCKETSHDTEANSPTELDEQQVEIEGKGEDKDEDDLTAHKVDQENKHSPLLDVLPKTEENGVLEDNAAESLGKDMDAVEQTSVPLASDTQTTGDVDSGWKMVLHEESNSYYYWNIVTGETSWEVPAVLGQGNDLAYEHKSALEDTHIADATLELETDASVATQLNNGTTNALEDGEIDGSMPELGVQNEKYTDTMANDEDKGDHVNIVDDKKTFSQEGFARHSTDALSNGEADHTDSRIEDMRGGDLSSDSSRLFQLGENLLERLKSMERSEGCNDQISNLMFELAIRLADIKSLVPYGSSLLPFWLHSENQLKKLEAAINNEVLKCSQPANIDELNNSENKLHSVPEASADEKNATSTDHPGISKEAEKDSSSTHPDNITQYPYLFVDGTAPRDIAEALPNTGLQSEDVDMDVEMEVEDEPGVQNGPPPGQADPPNPPTQDSLGLQEESDAPPPPNDEWIPPPPPDDEPLPPPPPDEPLEALPSETQTVPLPSYSYGEQFNYTYPASGFEYYGQTNTDVPSNGYYVDANGCQVAAPVPTLYYAAVPNPYSDTSSVVNSGEPVAYYTLQEGSAPTVPVHESIASDQTGAMVAQKDVSAVYRDIEKPSTEVPSVSVAPAEPVPKVQPKVSRNKKRNVPAVPTLRSNKKVSGLVDKWKAVKEELHEEEEDEPGNAYEALEKKRQRDIEQWLAQQIATGEAKDNANFQPLGGDWRERVRRKRAKKSSEAEENKGNESNQLPDLDQLTKQLPSGWQAYWDEASKQVYYGNSTTSETTWIKPTK